MLRTVQAMRLVLCGISFRRLEVQDARRSAEYGKRSGAYDLLDQSDGSCSNEDDTATLGFRWLFSSCPFNGAGTGGCAHRSCRGQGACSSSEPGLRSEEHTSELQ